MDKITAYGRMFMEDPLEKQARMTELDVPPEKIRGSIGDGAETFFSAHPKLVLVNCPICNEVMEYNGLFTFDNGIDGQTAWRFDCDQGHTILVDFTAQFCDEDPSDYQEPREIVRQPIDRERYR